MAELDLFQRESEGRGDGRGGQPAAQHAPEEVQTALLPDRGGGDAGILPLERA